jgi:sigma-B regulation protein RsbU (phosphoserine phosphatase)
MAEKPSQSAKVRALLLTLAVLFASATVVYSVAWMYYIRNSSLPVEIGIDNLSTPAGILVTKVWDGSPSRGAGLHAQDIITAIDGRSTAAPASATRVLFRAWNESQPGNTVALTIRRPGEAQPLSITPVFRAAVGHGDVPSLVRRSAIEVLGFYPLLFLIVGLAVLFLRSDDANAWLLALMFAGFITEADLPVAFALAPDRLADFLYGYAVLLRGVLPALVYFFFAVFPVRSPIDRKLPWLKWLLLASSALLQWGDVRNGGFAAVRFINVLASPAHIALVRIFFAYGTVLLGLLSLVWNVIGAPRIEDRRKLKVVLWGTLVGITPAVLLGLGYDLTHVETPFWAVFAKALFLFLVPLSFAYAVAKHRVMDIPVLLRRSARYLLVERGFTILILLLSVGVTLWFGQAFSLRFSAGSRAAIPIGASFGMVLILGAIQVHRQVRTRLDRAFFRSAYDAQQILENLAEHTLTVSDRPALAKLLHQQILEALHPVPLVIYLQSADGGLEAYAGDSREPGLALPANDAVLDRLAGRSGAFELNPEDFYDSALQVLHAECLVPIGGSFKPSTPTEGATKVNDVQLQGLIVLGPRLSEEPYSARDKRLLTSVASQAGIAMRSISLAERMAERIEAERRSEQEMQIARDVQSRLLPQEAPKLATLECAGKCIQTRAVGGDYYDFLEFGSGRLGIALADISGKGISGALLMANLQANLRGQYALALDDLPRMLRSVNTLFHKNTETNNYATMFFSLYDDASRTLRYVNCGHNPPILLRTSGVHERLEATATVLGLFEQWECSVASRQLAPGDVLLIYTDGISEAAPSEDAEEFGDNRLIATLQALQGKCAREILDGIIAEVQRFSQAEQADDMTLIVVRCR